MRPPRGVLIVWEARQHSGAVGLAVGKADPSMLHRKSEIMMTAPRCVIMLSAAPLLPSGAKQRLRPAPGNHGMLNASRMQLMPYHRVVAGADFIDV